VYASLSFALSATHEKQYSHVNFFSLSPLSGIGLKKRRIEEPGQLLAVGGAGGQALAAEEAPQPLRGSEEAVAEAVAEVVADAVQANEEAAQMETAAHFVGNKLGLLEKRKDFAGVIAGMRRHKAHARAQIAGYDVLHRLALKKLANAVKIGTLGVIERILEDMQQHHAIIEVQDAACDALHKFTFRSRDGPESNSAKIVAANGIRRILDAMALECRANRASSKATKLFLRK